MISSKQFCTGSLRSVHFLVCDGNCEMDEFLDSLRSQKPVEFDKLCRLFQFHCDSMRDRLSVGNLRLPPASGG